MQVVKWLPDPILNYFPRIWQLKSLTLMTMLIILYSRIDRLRVRHFGLGPSFSTWGQVLLIGAKFHCMGQVLLIGAKFHCMGPSFTNWGQVSLHRAKFYIWGQVWLGPSCPASDAT